MANIKSAEKRILVAERNRVRNRAARTQLRNQVKKFRAAIEAGDVANATQLLTATQAIIDRTTRKGVIHARTASRTMSRLAAAHAGLVGGAAR